MCSVRQPLGTRMSARLSALAHHRHAYPRRRTRVDAVPQRCTSHHAGVLMCVCAYVYLQNGITAVHTRAVYLRASKVLPGGTVSMIFIGHSAGGKRRRVIRLLEHRDILAELSIQIHTSTVIDLVSLIFLKLRSLVRLYTSASSYSTIQQFYFRYFFFQFIVFI